MVDGSSPAATIRRIRGVDLRLAARIGTVEAKDAEDHVVYDNRAILFVRVRWGKIYYQEDFEDTHKSQRSPSIWPGPASRLQRLFGSRAPHDYPRVDGTRS